MVSASKQLYVCGSCLLLQPDGQLANLHLHVCV